MSCDRIRESLEEYIMNELSSEDNEMIRMHILSCKECAKEYKDMASIINRLHTFKASNSSQAELLDNNKKRIIKSMGKKRWSFRKILPNIAACLFFMMFVLTSSAMVFPTFAYKYVPQIPMVKDIMTIREENSHVKQLIEEVKKENSELRMEIKKIKDVSIKEVVTSSGIAQEDNTAIQELVLEFIKAQYKKDINAIKSMCTDEFKAQIDKRKDDILWRKKGDVVFSTITNVAKEGDRFLVFVRLNETGSEGEADYQENFEIKLENGKYKVAFVGNDA